MGMDIFWWIQCMLEKSKPLKTNIIKKEFMELKSLKSKEVRILQPEKGKCTVVLNEITFKNISSLLESGVYGIICQVPLSQIESKVRQRLTKHNIVTCHSD
jgi:hypothetical protein